MSDPPSTQSPYTYFLVSKPKPYVTHVQINRPRKLNSFHQAMWLEFRQIFASLSTAPDVRVVVLSGSGDRAFTTGLDVQAASQGGVLGLVSGEKMDVARRAVAMRRYIKEFQACISSMEECEKHIATCADIRICSAEVEFAVKEVDIGLAADIGTLTRLPKVVGNLSWVKEVALSARTFGADEAYRVGYVSQVFESKALALEAALKLAELLASKSPIAVQGTKELLNHARDHTVADSLQYTGIWNSAALQTNDVEVALSSFVKKSRPKFEKL